MKGILVQTTVFGLEALREIEKTGIIGTDSKPYGSQPPMFEDKAMIWSSYFCKGYLETCGDRPGITFETESPIVYACPADTLELKRSAKWLPGFEKFIFPSIEEMLSKYPTSIDFKRDFQVFFRSLESKMGEIYDGLDPRSAELHYRMDYCLRPEWTKNPSYNEITFPKPLKLKSCRIFTSKKELDDFMIR